MLDRPFVLPAALLLGVAVMAIVGAGALREQDNTTFSLPDKVDFNYHIRPILSANCFVCHGPDPSSREADLRLDTPEGAMAWLDDSVRAIVPGHPDSSALLYRVAHEDPDERMPPEEMKKVLSAEEVALLQQWIDEGAEWKEHWFLIPPESPKVPAGMAHWGTPNTLDRFVNVELRSRGLQPAGEASRASQIRRLSYVLTGLPPTPEAVKAFEDDRSRDAYEKVVDRLLASPHFGERWARHWMDVARYADTRGHEFDYPVIGAWQYRDYLIRAFNQDVPYDQFIREQLTGDLLEDPRIDPIEETNQSVMGTAFFTLGEGTHSPVNVQEDETIRIDNIIDVSSKAFQGLTVACAKCHDHKFDPIPTTDYYALYGIIKSNRFANRAGNVTPKRIDAANAIRDLRKQVRTILAEQWKTGHPDASIPAVAAVSPPSNIQILGDFRTGDFDGWQLNGIAFGGGTTSGRLELNESGDEVMRLASPRASSISASRRLYGVMRSSNFIIDEQDVVSVWAAGEKGTVRVIIDNFQLIQNPIYGGLEHNIDSTQGHVYQFDLSKWRGRPAYVEVMAADLEWHVMHADDTSYVEVAYALRHAADVDPIPPIAEAPASSTHEALDAWAAGAANGSQIQHLNQLLQDGRLSTATESIAPLLRDIEALEGQLELPQVFAGVIEGHGADHPVFIRGNFTTPSEEAVPRRFLTELGGEESLVQKGSGRLEWADALLDPSNPLTSRVMVNRLWHHVFGRGIVETVDNFGVQGQLPTHPELLDHLAIKFRESGWSMKTMIKEMVMSEAFRRSTEPSRKALQDDPENLWLQRYPVRRLEAEAIRDALLTVSGRLDPTMYGEPVPLYLSGFMQGRGRPRVSGPLDGDGRRSLYQSIRRNFLPPFMLTFDMPIPFSTFGKRNMSNVPAQSLTMMNDPFVQLQAEEWAKRIVGQQGLGMEERINRMYMTAFGRPASKQELRDGRAFLENQARYFSEESEADVATLLAADFRPWREYAHSLFNMKEFIHLI